MSSLHFRDFTKHRLAFDPINKPAADEPVPLPRKIVILAALPPIILADARQGAEVLMLIQPVGQSPNVIKGEAIVMGQRRK